MSIFVHPGEMTNAPKRKALVAVLEMDNSEAVKHLSAAEFGLGNEPDSSARITWKINEHDVFGGN